MSTRNEAAALDLAGIGTAVKAIPPKAWQKLVETACDTFTALVAPLTATTTGLGQLISTKFNRLNDAEKVLVMATLERAGKKCRAPSKKGKAKNSASGPSPRTLAKYLETTASAADVGIQELWANLLAQEMLGGQTHPEVLRILENLCTEDAQLLVEINADAPKEKGALIARSLRIALSAHPFNLTFKRAENSFSHAKLKSFQLITRIETEWIVTTLGQNFLSAVSDPSED